jgi:hypothetical protein
MWFVRVVVLFLRWCSVFFLVLLVCFFRVAGLFFRVAGLLFCLRNVNPINTLTPSIKSFMVS